MGHSSREFFQTGMDRYGITRVFRVGAGACKRAFNP